MLKLIHEFYSYGMDFITEWLILWGFINLPRTHKKRVYLITGILQSIMVIVTTFFLQDYPDTVMLVRIFSVVFVMTFLFEGKFFKKMAYALLVYILLIFLFFCLTSFITTVIDISEDTLVHTPIPNIVLHLLNILIILLFIYIKRHITKSKQIIHISKRIYFLLVTGTVTGIMLIAAFSNSVDNARSDQSKRIMMIVILVTVIVYVVACILMIVITDSRDNYKSLSIISQNIIESQQKYYTLVQEKQMEMRSIRHEMKNHLACIYGLYKSNKLKEMDEYIRQVIEASDVTEDLFDTGNDIVNAILNDAQSKYKKESIAIRLQGGFPEELFVSPMDLCIIFANTVSNAIEAILLMEREDKDVKYIDIGIKSFKEDLFIDIRNPISTKTEIDIGKLNTIKSNKDIHGFGVKNVIQRVEKYNGAVNFRIENREFFVEIELKNAG